MRFLKAKLRVLQEELDQVCQESSEKDKAMAASAACLKQLTEHNTKLQRSYQTLQVGRTLAAAVSLLEFYHRVEMAMFLMWMRCSHQTLNKPTSVAGCI